VRQKRRTKPTKKKGRKIIPEEGRVIALGFSGGPGGRRFEAGAAAGGPKKGTSTDITWNVTKTANAATPLGTGPAKTKVKSEKLSDRNSNP